MLKKIMTPKTDQKAKAPPCTANIGIKTSTKDDNKNETSTRFVNEY
jgi:hypothetical protein